MRFFCATVRLFASPISKQFSRRARSVNGEFRTLGFHRANLGFMMLFTARLAQMLQISPTAL